MFRSSILNKKLHFYLKKVLCIVAIKYMLFEQLHIDDGVSVLLKDTSTCGL